MVNHGMMNTMAKITNKVASAVNATNITDKKSLSIIHLARKTPGYMIKKVYTWSPFIMQLKFYFLRTPQIQFVSYRHSAASGLPQDTASICVV